jgi:hypothetical protein
MFHAPFHDLGDSVDEGECPEPFPDLRLARPGPAARVQFLDVPRRHQARIPRGLRLGHSLRPPEVARDVHGRRDPGDERAVDIEERNCTHPGSLSSSGRETLALICRGFRVP